MKRIRYPVQIYRDEDPRFWNARIPGIGGDEFGLITCGNSPEEARAMAVEMLEAYVESKLKHDEQLEECPAVLPGGKGWEWIAPGPRVGVALMIRQARESAGLSQAEAARLMGVAPSTYNRWEQPGKCNATLSTLERIARTFGRHLEVQLR